MIKSFSKRALDRIAEKDRRFFERIPHRQYHLRLVRRAEIERLEVGEGRPMKVLPGCWVFAAIRSIAPGFRIVLFVLPNLKALATDPGEEEARAIFQWVAEPYREVEAREVEARMCRAAGVVS